MRYIILLIFISASAIAQPYSAVVEVKDASQSDLYSRATVWFAETFVSANNVLQVREETTGLLVGKGSVAFDPSGMGAADVKGTINFTVSISVKDGKYKYEFKDFVHSAYASKGYSYGDLSAIEMPKGIPNFYNKNWLNAKAMVESNVDALILSLGTAMNKKNDW